VKQLAKTVESELERKRKEKLKTNEFLQSGRNTHSMQANTCFREEYPDQQRQPSAAQQAGGDFARQVGKHSYFHFILVAVFDIACS
jgi:hypothetical protein